MIKQNQIKRTLVQPESIAAVRGFSAGASTPAALHLPMQFVRIAAFSTAAAPRRKRRTPRGLGVAMAAPLDAPEQAGAVRALQLLKVDSAQDLRLWNGLMCEHPHGAGVMLGAQMRYLIGSEHGWLGGLGFGASAIKLGDHDQWIG